MAKKEIGNLRAERLHLKTEEGPPSLGPYSLKARKKGAMCIG